MTEADDRAAEVAEAIEQVREDLKTLAGEWDQEALGPPLMGEATVSLSLRVSARNPVEAAEAFIDSLIRQGADTYVLEVRDRGADDEGEFFVRAGALVDPALVFGRGDDDDDADERDA